MGAKTARKSPQKKLTSSRKHVEHNKAATRAKHRTPPQSPVAAVAPRQPQKCQKCPGQPLRHQCAHTKRGRQYLVEQAALESLQRDLLQANDDPSRSLSPSPNATNDTSTSAEQREAQYSASSNPFLSQHSPEISIEGPNTPGSHFSSASGAAHTLSSAIASPVLHTRVQTMTTTDLANLSIRSSSSATSSSSRPSRTSAQNPYNGHVQGAYRGATVYQIIRGHQLPSPISDNTRSVKKFTNTINSIIEKCEDISKETGCWLFIGAQHATARAGAISYASPRLRRDAAEQVGNIGTQFSSLTRNLINARTQDTLDLQRQLEQSRREAEEMKKSLEAATKTQKELTSILGRFRTRYNLDSDDLH